MSVPCPCCKANNDAGPNCRRCKADLALLFAIERQQMRALSDAKRSLAAGRIADALAALDRADRLRRSPEAGRLRAMALLTARDFPAALRAYRACGSPGG